VLKSSANFDSHRVFVEVSGDSAAAVKSCAVIRSMPEDDYGDADLRAATIMPLASTYSCYCTMKGWGT
jgi:hypothetical protein